MTHPLYGLRRYRAFLNSFCLLLLLIAASTKLSATPIKAVTETNNYDDYVVFLAGRDPLEIENFTADGVRRSVVELVLMQQALALGGIPDKVEFAFSPNYVRMIHLVQAGDYVIAGNTAWQNDTARFSGKLHLSEPLIRYGEYEAGIYALTDNHKALAARTLEDLRAFRFVSNKHWTVDWRTLNALKIDQLYNVPMWETMLGMLFGRRVDFVLAPFSKQHDLTLVFQGRTFAPVQGLKIGLLGSRHYIVSPTHPDGGRIFNALNKGMKELRANGRIVQALTEAGFLNATVKDWTKIN